MLIDTFLARILTLNRLRRHTPSARTGDPRALRMLLEAASNADPRVHKYAQGVLGSLDLTTVRPLLLIAVHERDGRIRNDACVAAGMACARVADTIPGGYLFSKDVVGEGEDLKSFADDFVCAPWAGPVITKLCNNPAIPIRMLQNWLSSIHATLAASVERASLDTLHAALNLKAMSSGGPIRDVLSLDGIRKLASDELAKRDRAHIEAAANSRKPENADLEAFSTLEKALETFFAACARKDWETVCLCDSSTRPAGMRFEDSPREIVEDLSRTFGDGEILGSATVVGDNARVSFRATFPARTAELVLESGHWKIQDFSA